MKKTTLAAIAAMHLAGCSSLPVTEKSASEVPASRVYAPAALGPAVDPSQGTLVFLRDSGYFAGGCEHDVFLDNVKLFGIRVNEQITVHAPAGAHVIRLENETALCPTVIASQQTLLDAGTRQVFRVQMPSFGGVGFARVQ